MRCTDVRFRSGEDELAAWLYLPDSASALGSSAPLPCVVLAHGFGATREARLDAYGSRFAESGYAALAFDYRGFGGSGGEPRQLIDIGRQQDDWRAAISFARSLPEVDPDQVVAWGTSFSGGHVAVIAAEDERLAGVISQNAFMDGPAALRALGLAAAWRLTVAGLRDEWARLRGRDPFVIPIVAEPGETGAMSTPDAVPGYAAMFEGTPWVNEFSARAGLRAPFYRPGTRAAAITCPWLVQVADDDAITPAAPAVAAAARAPSSQVRRYPGGHFDVYVGEGFERAVSDQIAFLRRVLPPVAVPAPVVS
jgi:fermentation-respiration switch protein FrsA (DUF1100 family)